MSRSFTFSSRLARFRGWFATAAAIGALLAIIEGVLRIPAVRDALPIRTHLREPGAVVRLQTLERLLESEGHVDVLFVGSSIVRCNISPTVFDPIVEDGQHRLVSFNAGLSGLWPAAVRLYLEDLWLRTARPRVVVQGIRYGELFPSTRARSYASISSGIVESSWEQPDGINRLKARAFETFRVLQYRGAVASWMLRYRNGRPNPVEEDDVRVFTDARGWTPRTPTLDVVLSKDLLKHEQPNGLVPDSFEYRDAVNAIRRSYRATRRAGAQYVLVNVPEYAFRWSGADGRQRYEAFLDAMQRVADDEGFPFIDVTGGDLTLFSSPLEYSDYHHMSPAGALRFTTLLAAQFRARYEALLQPAVMRASFDSTARSSGR